MRALELKVPPVAQGLIAAAAMGLLGTMVPLGAFRFPGQLLAASVVLLAGGLVGLGAVRAFVQARTTANPLHPERAERLVCVGIYRYTRNAMYLALLLALVSWGIWLGNIAALLVIPLFVAAMTRFQIRPEERALEARFGAEFVAYKRKVRRWL